MAYSAVDLNQRGRLRDLDLPGSAPGGFIDFFYIPGEISDSVNADWQEHTIIGRSSPLHFYGSTSARTIQLELNFVAETNAFEEVFQKVAWIQSLKYPEYRGKYMRPPHRVSLIIGRFISLDGILKTADVTWRAPYDSETKFPMLAVVNLSIEEAVETPYGYERVRDAIKVGIGDLLETGGEFVAAV